MELQAVLFDMDGLLVNTEPLWFEVESEVMASLGGDWSEADQANLVGGSLQVSLDYLLGKARRPVSKELLARWMLDGMVSRLARAPVALRPGAADLLAEVRVAGVAYGLVTSSERVIMEAVFRAAALDFPVTVCAEDVTKIKPESRAVPAGHQAAGCRPGRQRGARGLTQRGDRRSGGRLPGDRRAKCRRGAARARPGHRVVPGRGEPGHAARARGRR